MYSFDPKDVREAISRHTGRQITSLSFVEPERRRYSEVLLCDVDFAGEVIRYVVKCSAADVVGPWELQTTAEAHLRDYPGFVGTSPLILEKQNVILSRYLPSRPLSSMLVIHNPLDVFLLRRRLQHAVVTLGTWLKRYHLIDWREQCDETLAPYLEKRPELLRFVPESVARRVAELAREPVSGPSVGIHGDFTVQNTLFAGKTFTIIDFDAYDWRRMSPFWDIACMVVSLQRSGLFSVRSPFFWWPNGMDFLIRQFLNAYGLPSLDERELLKCLVFRHLTHFATHATDPRSSRQSWHLRKATEYLARVDKGM